MIHIKIFDTHCDTVYKTHEACIGFDNDIMHISQNSIEKYDKYEQMFAIWSNPKRDANGCFEHYKLVKQFYNKEILPCKNDNFIPHLAVEGGALLDNDITRLDMLKQDGVRMMTLVWRDECCMGGAHNNNIGLSNFGKDAVKRMCELGIIPDVSHASDKMTYETLDIARGYGIPVCASHSNSRKIHSCTRNLTDDMFLEIKNNNGLVGINLYPNFLEDTDIKNANITSIIRHIEHFLSLGGEDTICLGCDFDGVDALPDGIKSVKDLDKLYAELIKINYSQQLVEKIFYNNAHNFFEQHK